jgi:hypothetical protein
MAVTFHAIPKAYSPSDNPLSYEFSSNQTGQANFSFIVVTYFDGTPIAEDQVYVSNGIRAQFDVSKHVSPLLPAPTRTTDLMAEITHGKIKLKVTENYGVTPAPQATATSAETITWKSRISDDQFITENFGANYKNLKFLTNKPEDSIYAPFGQDVYLSMITGVAADVAISIDVEGAGGNITTIDLDLTPFEICQFNFGSDYFIGAYPLVTYLLLNVNGVTYKVYFTAQECDPLNALYWVNEYGTFDQYTFDHNKVLSGSTTSKGYTKQFGNWDAGSFVFNLDAGERNNQVQTITSIKLSSGYMNSAIQNWLNGCIQSALHWVALKPYRLTTANFENEDDRYEDLISFEVELENPNMIKSPNL